ncbi:MAG: acylneuraminate cytidylyltransferase family protein [Deltaproteobacteria bacterium]|nr:acylneuraminate cytidylyltransferase family protein [Deltaproteobacteria bacterium]
MKQYIVGFIFARVGSQGVPGKNIRFLADKPLIAYAIETAFQSQFIDRVVVSTDDEKIARVAQDFGAEVPFVRPKELAQNNSPEWLAWQHAIRTLKEQDNGRELDVFVSIPPTAPLRSVEDVDNAIQTFLESDADIVITAKKASRHPSFNMITLDEQNCAKLVLPLDKQIIRRQDTPPVYDMTTVAYVASPKFIMESNAVFEGRVKAVLIPEERALDIDTELDFQFAEYLMTNRMKRK